MGITSSLLILSAAFQLLWAENVVPPPTPELLNACQVQLAKASRLKSPMDLVLDTLNPTALVMNRVIGVSHRRIAPPIFFMPSEKGLVLGINGVQGGEPYLKSADFMTGHSFQVERYVQQARVTSIKDMIAQLVRQYELNGPIYKLVIAAHGAPGEMSIGGQNFNAKWIRDNIELLKSLPKDLFVKDAEVALVSCSTAGGSIFEPKRGQKELEAIFLPLLRNGGKVIAATRYVDPELSHIPVGYSTAADRVLRHLLVCPIKSIDASCGMLLADMQTWLKKVVEIQIPASAEI